MSDLQNENSQESSSKTKTPSKRTPSKRLTKIERAQLESVEVIKSMGGSLDIEGGRRTRSSVRGNLTPSTPATPPPAKKSRQLSSTTTPRRGRPKKLSVGEDEMKNEEKVENETKLDETTVEKPDDGKTTGTKSDTLEKPSGRENVHIISKKDVSVAVTPTLPSTEKEIEKSEVDASKLETITHENNIKEKKQETLIVPDVVVTAATPEKQQLINNVPENKLDPVEPMEVDSSISQKQPEEKETNLSVVDEHKVTQPTVPTTNNCTSSVTDEALIENNVNKNEEVQEIVETKNNIDNSTDEIINNKSVVNDKLIAETDKTIPQNDKINSIVENDKQQEPSNANKIIAESDDKKENDNCEPKISSSPPSDGIVQPQTCN